MSDDASPLTDKELLALEDVADLCDERDAYFTPKTEPTIRSIEKLSPEGNHWVGLPPDVARRVVADIRRLRDLIRKAVDEFEDGNRDPSDYEQGCCFWCGEHVAPESASKGPHAPQCPWPAMVEEADRA